MYIDVTIKSAYCKHYLYVYNRDMNKQSAPRFIQEDSVSTRRNFGEYLDRVQDGHDRFAITKRGQVVALLVPVSDGEAIEQAIQATRLDRMYQAIDAMKGLLADTAATDTSRRIDDFAYGTEGVTPEGDGETQL